jgi:hypothetical protein
VSEILFNLFLFRCYAFICIAHFAGPWFAAMCGCSDGSSTPSCDIDCCCSCFSSDGEIFSEKPVPSMAANPAKAFSQVPSCLWGAPILLVEKESSLFVPADSFAEEKVEVISVEVL